jgi:uncharacterized protein with ParB-like and HNH nuclease domain
MRKHLNEEELQLESDDLEEDEVLVEYDIATYPSDFTLSGIHDMWKAGDITIPEFQREFVWTVRQSSLLVESFLSGLPVPPVFFYIDDENKNLVIDGQQRILSMIFFFEGYFGRENLQGKRQVFRLQGLDEKSPYFRKRFMDLDESDQRKLRNSVLRAINVRQLAPSGENTSIYHIFERLNTGGTPLKPQEIRNCVFRGKIVGILHELNADKNWRLILGKKPFDKHQTDVELVLRLFALSKHSNDYEKPMKEFLHKTMKKNRNGNSPRVKRFRDLFRKTTELIVKNLGERPFHVRGPLNTSVLDSVFCILLDNIEHIPSNLKQRFDNLLGEKKFVDLTTLGTTDTKILKERFNITSSYLIG